MKNDSRFAMQRMTSPQFGEAVASQSLVVLLPVGSVEPHGPHMSLLTDTAISVGVAQVAAEKLESHGLRPVIAPSIPYGVTECAAAFPGAISVPGDVLTAMLAAVADAYLHGGAKHVCIINNHLEPDQDRAIRKVLEGRTKVSVACPLTRKWARTLSGEFKSGACHAGQYETSIVLALDEAMVDAKRCAALPEVPISLATELRAGRSDFLEMGLTEAYAGSPAQATADEGTESLALLAEMVVGEVLAVLEGEGA